MIIHDCKLLVYMWLSDHMTLSQPINQNLNPKSNTTDTSEQFPIERSFLGREGPPYLGPADPGLA